jgi:hypothetical protein
VESGHSFKAACFLVAGMEGGYVKGSISIYRLELSRGHSADEDGPRLCPV